MNRPLQQLQLCLAPVSKNEAARVGAASMVRDASQRTKLCSLSLYCTGAATLLRLYVPFLEEATHPQCGCEGYPDWPGRASSKEGES